MKFALIFIAALMLVMNTVEATKNCKAKYAHFKKIWYKVDTNQDNMATMKEFRAFFVRMGKKMGKTPAQMKKAWPRMKKHFLKVGGGSAPLYLGMTWDYIKQHNHWNC